MDKSEIGRFYQRMGSAFGRAWKSSYTQNDMELWWEAFKPYTGTEVFLAASEWIKTQERPPNMGNILRILQGKRVGVATPQITGPEPGSSAWLRQREEHRKVAGPFIKRAKELLSGNSEYTGSSPDQRKRAMQALKNQTPEGTARAHRILTEHIQQPAHV